MKIYDEITREEIKNPDCGYGSMLCYSKTGNGAVSTITRYDKAGH